MRLAGILGNNDGEKTGLTKTFSKLGGEFGGEFLTPRRGRSEDRCLP